MQNSGFTVAITDCGVTPQAQNTGNSSLAHFDRVAVVGLHDILDADQLRLADMHGRAVHRRKAGGDLDRADGVASASAAASKRPSGRGMDRPRCVAIEVRYIGTLQPRVMWRSSMPSAISASSNENEQPITKLTRSSRQKSRMSSGSATSSPFFQTR